MVLLGRDFNVYMDYWVSTEEGDRRHMTCAWFEVSARVDDLIILRNQHCLMLVPEDTSRPLHILASSCLQKSLLRWELQLQTFPGLQESFLDKCLTSSFDGVL